DYYRYSTDSSGKHGLF
nr:immunoglobulin light chain junction region [Macaca mulatta]